MEAVQIGPFYVNWSLFTIIASAVAGYAAVSLIIRRTDWRQSPLMDIIFGAMVIGLFAWKLTPYLLQPSMIWRSPLKGLLMQGGLYAMLIGAAAAVLYLFIRAFRAGLPLRLVADALGYGGAVFLAVRALVGGARYGTVTTLPWGITLSDPAYAYHPIHLYELLLALLLLAIFLFGKIKPGSGRAGELSLQIGGAGLFAVSLLVPGGTAAHQWIMLAAAAIGLILPRVYILWDDNLRRSWKPDEHEQFEGTAEAAEREQE